MPLVLTSIGPSMYFNPIKHNRISPCLSTRLFSIPSNRSSTKA